MMQLSVPRRAFLAAPALLAARPGLAQGHPLAADWALFKARYVQPDGRVVDTANGNVSHSEGQSYAMLLAVEMDDRPTFDAAWSWARTQLRRRSDALLAWRHDPALTPPVQDLNNATDGDLFAAWALARAAARWRDPSLAGEARSIARDILRLCVTEWAGMRLLLPGAAGFRHPGRVVVNLSYYSWGALRALSRLLPDPAWAELEADGLALLAAARFGRHGLPPDWLEVTAQGEVRLAQERPPRFSWDAVRVPVHLAWAGMSSPVLVAADAFWASRRVTPAWVDLRTGQDAPYPGHAGIRAAHRVALATLGKPVPPHEGVAAATDYYGSALVLLSWLALADVPEEPAARPAAPQGEGRGAGLADAARARLRAFLARTPGAAEVSQPLQAMPVRGTAIGPRVAPPRWHPNLP